MRIDRSWLIPCLYPSVPKRTGMGEPTGSVSARMKDREDKKCTYYRRQASSLSRVVWAGMAGDWWTGARARLLGAKQDEPRPGAAVQVRHTTMSR
jgi:hypothetical protein